MNQAALTFFAIGALWIAYVYAGYPLALAIIGGFRRVRPRSDPAHTPGVSVLIAARNEERDIGWKLQETLSWDYPANCLEILVASDASEDRTDEIVSAAGDARIRLTRMEKRGGKIRALNCIVPQAKGELLLFTDANAHISASCMRMMARHFADERVGCVTGDSCSIREEANGVSSGAAVYWGYEAVLKRLESMIGSVLVCDGAIFCIRRSLYESLLPDLANDLETPMRIAERGYWVLHEPEAIVFERDTSSPKEEFARRRRICGQGSLGMWKLRHTLRGLRGWQFVSHKLLRWLTLVPLLLMLIASALLAAHPLFAICFAVQGAFYGLALTAFAAQVSGRPFPGILATPFYVVLGALGAMIGVLETCRGRRFDIWEIPALSRGGSGAA